jgi:antitoxin CptB
MYFLPQNQLKSIGSIGNMIYLFFYCFLGSDGMSQQVEKARMLWRCRRGMLELDLLLERFMAEGYDNLTDEQLVTFKSLLEEPDPDLYAWLMGYEKPSQQEFKQFVDWFRLHFCQANR